MFWVELIKCLYHVDQTILAIIKLNYRKYQKRYSRYIDTAPASQKNEHFGITDRHYLSCTRIPRNFYLHCIFLIVTNDESIPVPLLRILKSTFRFWSKYKNSWSFMEMGVSNHASFETKDVQIFPCIG